MASRWTHQNAPMPQIILGDFNIVEDSIDRLPPKPDDRGAVDAYRDLKSFFNVVDGWRREFPTKKGYTFQQPGAGSQSRIDKILLTNKLFVHSTNWDIKTNPIPRQDHDLVSCDITDQAAPYIGPGRWKMPRHILQSEEVMNYVQERGKALQASLVAAVRANHDVTDQVDMATPQQLYAEFKNDITTFCKKHTARKKSPAQKKIDDLETERQLLLDDDSITPESKNKRNAEITEMIKAIKSDENLDRRMDLIALFKLYGETISKTWSNMNRSVEPRDMIYSLYDPNTEDKTECRKTKDMAELARNYHNNLQRTDDGVTEEQKMRETEEVLGVLKTELNNEQSDEMGLDLNEDEIRDSLRRSKSDSSPGIDGIPFDFFKLLELKHRQSKKAGHEAFDIIRSLCIVYNDIKHNGIEQDSQFTEGWMNPLYKKNEKNNIANYRPITLLNTDYKILTKALSDRMSSVIHGLIHENQAGFIRGRSIFDQTNLARLMPRFAEATKQNGAIVCLDQEKAYDKIDHTYLWAVLDKFRFPPTFINFVKSLYETAETSVMVNGVLSTKWKVYRGVRQGDPLMVSVGLTGK